MNYLLNVVFYITGPQTPKTRLGQFMTLAAVARFMASLFPAERLHDCHLLDAGAGLGALTCAFLNSTAVDTAFRRFSGHTQINATDLRRMKYPDRDTLISLGEKAMREGGKDDSGTSRCLAEGQ